MDGVNDVTRAGEAGPAGGARLTGPIPLRDLYELLRDEFGQVEMWPAQSGTEYVCGAVLVQNTAWGSVQRALEDHCNSEEELVHQVAVTVIHEVGHHFGLDDADLHRLGWG